MTANLALVAPATALSATRKLRCKCSASCDAETNNLFAQGHDARLVSLQVAAVMAGETTANEATLLIAQLAGSDSPLIDKFLQAAKRAAERELARAQRAASKVARKAPAKVTAKVGRWVREGQVIDGSFHYTDKQGRKQITSKFTLV